LLVLIVESRDAGPYSEISYVDVNMFEPIKSDRRNSRWIKIFSQGDEIFGRLAAESAVQRVEHRTQAIMDELRIRE